MTEDANALAVRWGIPLAIAFIAVLARAVMTAPKITVWSLVRGTIVGIFVGACVNLYLSDIEAMSAGTRGAIVGVSAIIAEDIVIVLLAGGRKLREKPSLVWDFILRRK